jgi:hypothetical protein
VRVRGHLTGGTVAAFGVAAAASGLELVPPAPHPLWWGVAATTLLFSLLPDIDTDSLPRRWFYRAVLAALAALAWHGQWRLATLLAGVSMLPLVDHHRGWTHGRWMPLLAPAVLAALLWWLAGRAGGTPVTPMPAHAAYLAAAVAGWYTHLLLDGLFRIFPHDPA